MKSLVALITLLVLVVNPACSPTITQTREQITPASYQDYQSDVPRSMGLLRRLVILPPQFVYVHNYKRQPEKEAQCCARMLTQASAFLRDWKGYEIILYYENQTPGRTEISQVPGQPDPSLQPLFEWTKISKSSSSTPADVKTLVANICRPVGADGLLVLQGYKRPFSTYNFALCMLTASLTWPLLFVEEKEELQAHIFEAATGNLVWSCRQKYCNEEQLFSSLENAVPAALIKR